MGRVSVKENKNMYQLKREALGLSRERASELLEGISPERIEKIESEKSLPHPDEVLLMAQGYKDPALCNYFCARECPIGRKYVPQIAPRSLSEIVLEMLASLNGMQAKRERLIEITSNGRVDDHEVEDFVKIQETLAKISETAEALRLWEEQMLAEGKINMDLYKQFRGEKRKG
ncbi:MAG: helix-turn-helix transcriptional regulator [Lachnospiraceae bacterium]|nr:helix-turn-helix transcriptional regulator [Lachnospiraceae bacterium]